MNTVTLRSKVGPVHCVYRPSPVEKVEFDWSFDNNFRCEVPVEWWEKIRDSYLDKRTGLRYRQALIPN